MDNWILKGVNTLVHEECGATQITETQVKVKVTHLFISNYDALLYCGAVKAKYPKTPGRFAIGIVTEVGANCYGIEKGARVFLEPTRSCGTCISCKSGKSENCTDIQIAGRDFDGFMRDFVVCEYNEVTPLPDIIDNMLALCIETVGIAENIYDKLNLTAGQRVAVVGANFTGNIIAQVLQYHKVIPIVIDNNPENLECLKKCDIFYAYPADDELVPNVMDATSGELCDAAIYVASSNLPINVPCRLLGKKKSLVITGFSDMRCSIETRDIIEKDLTVFGVNDAYRYTGAVINLMLHNAINIDFFNKEVLTNYDPIAILKARCDKSATESKGKMTVLKMIL